MNKENFDNLLKLLNEKSYKYSFDDYIDRGVSVIRGIFLYTDGEDHIKNRIDKDLLKNVKLRKTYRWYLGEKKKAIYMKFKDALEMEIPELEAYQINNYA